MLKYRAKLLEISNQLRQLFSNLYTKDRISDETHSSWELIIDRDKDNLLIAAKTAPKIRRVTLADSTVEKKIKLTQKYKKIAWLRGKSVGSYGYIGVDDEYLLATGQIDEYFFNQDDRLRYKPSSWSTEDFSKEAWRDIRLKINAYHLAMKKSCWEFEPLSESHA